MNLLFKFLIIFLMFCEGINSQNTFKAKYKVNIAHKIKQAEVSDRIKNERHRMFLLNSRKKFNKMVKSVEKFHYNLEFNKIKSIFYLSKSLETTDRDLYFFKKATNFYGEYHSLKGVMTNSVNAYGEDFLVKRPNYIWSISSTSKRIGKYLCYKATTTEQIHTSKGVFKKRIIAWFAPEIPFNYGPRDYIGLPGLIIELQDGKRTYLLQELKSIIKIKTENKKGQKITLTKFNLIGKKINKKRHKI
ncbi:GLPGLI family protein [Tenacibaculum finnmarkense]|nr:GLPGLI family protein [Tenacibaculum finnmarkense]MCD8412602.1 GLPGLI family protein [Tenacibaculum finnmarkense genomovar ulcerans]MCG8206345.1 GLPGLI family protein [Tenacibaculum finnmarkense genomovar finnmarkense]MCG8722389.1 GLPGLI family protein [Tenacibaculum finnmarkense]MCG8740698.1 GLPGLI family protein [Tenacibaculum finnmarkense]MCG8764058.1 GLPGLI family protein [Tenacibaculum finnmarkense]